MIVEQIAASEIPQRNHSKYHEIFSQLGDIDQGQALKIEVETTTKAMSVATMLRRNLQRHNALDNYIITTHKNTVYIGRVK